MNTVPGFSMRAVIQSAQRTLRSVSRRCSSSGLTSSVSFISAASFSGSPADQAAIMLPIVSPS